MSLYEGAVKKPIIRYFTVFINEYITVAGTCLLNDSQIRNNYVFCCTEVQCRTGKHSRTHTLVFIIQSDLHLECTGSSIYGRVNQVDGSCKDFITIYIEFHVDIELRYSRKRSCS